MKREANPFRPAQLCDLPDNCMLADDDTKQLSLA